MIYISVFVLFRMHVPLDEFDRYPLRILFVLLTPGMYWLLLLGKQSYVHPFGVFYVTTDFYVRIIAIVNDLLP